MSTKRVQARLQRLEEVEQQRALRRRAERIAREQDVDAEEVLLQLEEIGKRIERWGVDAEVRRLAREYSKSEDEVRARIDAISEEMAEALR